MTQRRTPPFGPWNARRGLCQRRISHEHRHHSRQRARPPHRQHRHTDRRHEFRAAQRRAMPRPRATRFARAIPLVPMSRSVRFGSKPLKRPVNASCRVGSTIPRCGTRWRSAHFARTMAATMSPGCVRSVVRVLPLPHRRTTTRLSSTRPEPALHPFSRSPVPRVASLRLGVFLCLRRLKVGLAARGVRACARGTWRQAAGRER